MESFENCAGATARGRFGTRMEMRGDPRGKIVKYASAPGAAARRNVRDVGGFVAIVCG